MTDIVHAVMPWVTEHWWLAFWALFWMLIIGLVLIIIVLRTVKVIARGWPPEHCDADGDPITTANLGELQSTTRYVDAGYEWERRIYCRRLGPRS